MAIPTVPIKPSIGILLGGLPLVAAFYVIGLVLYELFLSPYRKIPGPWPAKFTRFWQIRAFSRGNFPKTLLQLHSEHGPVVRIGPNSFSFDHPADIGVIYGIRTEFLKSNFYHGLGDPSRPLLFTTANKVFHTERKRQIAGMYTMSTMVNYEPAVDELIITAHQKLGEFAREGSLVPMDKFFQYFALDLVARITYGQDFGTLHNFNDTQGVLKYTEKASWVGPVLGMIPEIVPWYLRLNNLLAKKGPGTTLTAFARKSIAKARVTREQSQPHSNPKADSFVNKCLTLEDAGKFDAQVTIDSCVSNINAGSDTTGSNLGTIIYHLYQNPRSLQRLREELEEALSKRLVSSPLTFHEAQTHLPYLNAVVNEGLRIMPSPGFVLARSVPTGGTTLAGHYFAAGAEVGCTPVAMHLNQRYHGPDCVEWRPERWLDLKAAGNDPESKLARSFAFGGGTRICLGKNISTLEMTKLIPEFVQKYDLEFERDMDTGADKEPQYSCSTTAWLRYKCYVRVRA